MMGEWKSIAKHGFPKKNGFYLIHAVGCNTAIAFFTNNLDASHPDAFKGFDRPGWYDYDATYGYFEWLEVTHWMPLPEPPEEVE